MENLGSLLRACSGCPGDYEDPDRTSWEPDPNDADPGNDSQAGISEHIDWWVDEAGEA